MIDTAIYAAREAGKILRASVGLIPHIEYKDGNPVNLVTESDKACEARVISILLDKFPGHSILGEESGALDTGSAWRWIIDPLDGTTNFAHGLPIFSVSIALEVEGEVTLGVVYDPMRDELFHAEKGKGAFLNDRPIHVTRQSDIRKALLVTGFPYNVDTNPDYCFESFIAFLRKVQAVRRLGSAALDCAYVAAGRFDGFWEVALQPWDKAAGQLLITEAGGTISDFEGNAHDNYIPQFLGNNGMIHQDMLAILAEAKKITIST
jgi:myo-inositol-1(or 4)-monophosphatase